ncbi:ABC-type multidrug transport system, ATPase and permease component [Mucilaginibacter pineti]|uniref:ABC-type multidrug transport system, ATPase and permease component n=1 Tax=Mucilaginibacter pineti TaxID=1391627 RepID=A0A1G6T8R0_9SPHI|nr:ABC transporter ATP-binding protein [Mucilaginibacter pineti]SDD25431.1 ABC-type multidrug transport system, ATPase and permease component [Mucilaginibacter pineti]
MKQIIKGILTLLTSHEKSKLYRLILFDLLISGLDIVFLGLLLLIIGFYTSGDHVQHHLFLLPDGWFSKNSILLIALFLLLFSFKNWLGYLLIRFQHHFFYGVASRLSKKNIINYLKNDYTKFINIDSSVHIRQISQQPIEFSHYILTNAQQVISQGILIVFTVGAILVYQPVLFLLLLVLMVPPVICLAYFIRRRSKQVRIHTKLASEKTIQHLQETLMGYVESSIYDKGDFLVNRYYTYQQQLNDNLAQQQTIQGLPPRLVEVFAILGFFILVLINKWSAHGPVVDLLTIGVFMAAAYKIIPGIIKILNSTGQIKTYEFTLNDLLAANNSPILTHYINTNKNLLINNISFININFSYKEQPILTNLSFQLNKGDMVGLSAASGKGKTTLINLLLGFLTPANGEIYINDNVADVMTRQKYWKNIAYIKQQPWFIHDTVLKNITLTEGDYDSEKLTEIIAFCGLEPLLAGYSDGTHQVIRENGKNLSGGQRQRIMLARALYHNFDLLIMDEPFGEMDQEAEEAILMQLKQLAISGKIILFITHNLASLKHCNKLIKLI